MTVLITASVMHVTNGHMWHSRAPIHNENNITVMLDAKMTQTRNIAHHSHEQWPDAIQPELVRE